jgi:hypothetical protein
MQRIHSLCAKANGLRGFDYLGYLRKNFRTVLVSLSCFLALVWLCAFVIDWVWPTPFYEFILIGNKSLSPLAARSKSLLLASASGLSLPETEQSTDRILVAITMAHLGDAKAQLSMTLQLDHYLSLCEDGYEVHIVFVTKEANFDKNSFGFGAHSRYHCFRMGVSMRMFLSTWKNGTSPFLAAYHRRLFSDYATDYDWFISQESDIIVRSANFKYFQKYSAAFGERPLYPGFAIVEKPSIQNLSLTWMPFVGGRQIMDVATLSGFPSLVLQNPWAPMYILSQQMLARVSKHGSWKLDEYGATNVHFQHTWLTSFFKIIIPLQAIDNTFLLHPPSTKSELSIKKFAGTNKNRDAVVVEELLYVMQSCAGVVTPKFPFNRLKIQYRAKKAHSKKIGHPFPCLSCLNLNMTASLRVGFQGDIKRAIAFDSALANVFISCSSDVLTQVKDQNSPKSKVRVKTQPQ